MLNQFQFPDFSDQPSFVVHAEAGGAVYDEFDLGRVGASENGVVQFLSGTD